MCLFFVSISIYLFIYLFWVLCGSQCPIWNNSVWASYYSVWASTSSLWSSWVFGVLNLQSPSIFPFYVSVSLLNNQASNLQQSKTSSSYPRPHHPRSSPLIDYTGMIRSPSINITLSLCMGFCLMISFMGFSMRLGDGGRGVDEKSRISCGFGIFFFSLYKFLIWFLVHPYKILGLNSSITAAQGHWVMETSGLHNF